MPEGPYRTQLIMEIQANGITCMAPTSLNIFNSRTHEFVATRYEKPYDCEPCFLQSRLPPEEQSKHVPDKLNDPNYESSKHFWMAYMRPSGIYFGQRVELEASFRRVIEETLESEPAYQGKFSNHNGMRMEEIFDTKDKQMGQRLFGKQLDTFLNTRDDAGCIILVYGAYRKLTDHVKRLKAGVAFLDVGFMIPIQLYLRYPKRFIEAEPPCYAKFTDAEIQEVLQIHETMSFPDFDGAYIDLIGRSQRVDLKRLRKIMINEPSYVRAARIDGLFRWCVWWMNLNYLQISLYTEWDMSPLVFIHAVSMTQRFTNEELYADGVMRRYLDKIARFQWQPQGDKFCINDCRTAVREQSNNGQETTVEDFN